MKETFNPAKSFVNHRGFTLLEVLIAMVIVSIGALGLAMMQGTAVQANTYSNQLTQATALAQSTLEQFSVQALDSLTVAGIHTDIDENGNPGGPFTRIWTVVPNTDFSSLLTVNVAWNNASVTNGPNDTHTVQLSTITRGAHN